MKRLIAALGLVPLISAHAYAQDVDWTGFYAGIFGGGSIGQFDWEGPALPGDPSAHIDGSSYILGASLGYKRQFGNGIIAGIDIDLALTDQELPYDKALFPTFGDSIKAHSSGSASLRGRFGYAAGRLLPYVTAGLAAVETTYDDYFTATSPEPPLWSGVAGGWTVGAGMEYALSDRLSLSGEYRFTSTFTSQAHIGPPGLGYDDLHTFRSNDLRVGLNYRF